ncbi:MAG: hypothetical protein JSS91_08840 [Bacteroidetes bacterium]|nr:hypothetical protein [Bacteroidota bacterium]
MKSLLNKLAINIFPVTALIFMLAFSSCGKKEEKISLEKKDSEQEKISSAGIRENGNEFDVKYNFPRRIFKIEKEDLNDDGNREIIVLSVLKDTSEKFDSYYNFDMIEVFALDRSQDRYIKILSDTVDYSTDISFDNISGEKGKQILIKTNTGGNDPISSEGMFIYAMKDTASIELIKFFETGSPDIEDLKEDGKREIVVKDQFLGVMPQVNAVDFIREIYKMKDNKLILSNNEFPEVYNKKIGEVTDKYYGLKRKVEMGMQPLDMSYPLYREAAEIFVNYYSKGDMQGLRKFWEKEKESLSRNIPQDEYNDLNTFISKALPSSKNA